ncbi:hypothetical protein [Hydromonas duriensis]|uniref:TnsE C-terminal domain-containing protein n=1 Tax=Hydromonas duriensis TaxID=1527608 RepID=A0A4R6Y9M6_9BURK|nr:hypothetical protein [Hydromonas duriensis]TDR32152.1 hypothetical protein DFR44_10535 [Hydromonas duriensis]
MAKVVKIAEFPDDGRLWRIDWLGAVQHNEKNIPTENTIDVYLRPVDPQRTTDFGMKITERVCRQVGVGQLPLLTIGSLWHKGQLLDDIRAVQRQTNLHSVLVNSSTVKLIKAGHQDEGNYAISKFHFDIGGIQNGLSANCLAIERNGDPYGIIIPVSEVIRFYYASSSDLSNIAFSGMYENDFDSMVGEFHHMHPEQDMFIIELKQWLEDNDGWTIGRLLQEPCADEAFKLIHRSLVKQSVNTLHKKAMPETNFPFQGRTNWTAHCLNIQSGGKNRTLILELLHCTAPFPFSDLHVIRKNDGRKADPETDISDDDKIECWPNTKVTKPCPDNDIPLQSETEAYRYAKKDSITLKANRFAALENKKIHKDTKEQCKYKASQLIPCQSIVATGLGTGLGTTGDSTIIPVQITVTAEDEEKVRRQREKALEASFETMMQAVRLLNQYSNTKASIRQSRDGYFIPLASAKTRQWSYLDSKKKKYRSVLVADIQVDERYFWLVEFEQRKADKCTSALIEIPNHYSDNELLQLLRGLAREYGIWRNIKHSLDLKIVSMKHTWSTPRAYAEAVYNRTITDFN